MDALVPGCRVLLTDLVSRKDLNGEEGLLLLWIDAQQRWAVRLVNKTAAELKVKPANVVRSPSGFDCLNEDALLLALVRTSVSSHQPLFATNWRIRKVIDNPDFFRSRLRLGFAKVAVTLDPKERDPESEAESECDREDGTWGENEHDDDDDDELGHQGDYECTRHFSATIQADNMDVGSFSCTLVNRTACRTHRVFLSACDAESQELVDIGRVLFDDRGEPRTTALKADPETKQGGFLYIEALIMDRLGEWYPQELGTALYFPQEGATNVSSQAVKQLLALDPLEYRWSVAAYIAYVRHEAARREADEEQMAEGLASECRHFVRANFQEIESPQASEGWVYTTKALQLLPRLSHREALCVPLKFAAVPSKPLRPEPEGVDAELSKVLRQYDKTPSLAEIDLLLQAVRKQCNPMLGPPPYTPSLACVWQGATVDRAYALHYAAHKLDPELVTALAQRGGSVDAADPAGRTPLMVAAGTVRGRTGGPNTHEDVTCIDRLLQHGANVSLIDDDGLTALGVYRMSVRHYDDFNSTFSRPRKGADPTVEARLRPPGGPTPADEELK